MTLISLMERYFGRSAQIYLIREIKQLGFNSVLDMDDDSKLKLVNNLINNLFDDILSRQKLHILRSELIHSLNLSDGRLTKLSQKQRSNYFLSRHVI